MEDQWTRTRMLIGESGIAALRQAKVAVFGLGGVGGQVAEALARSGVGELALVDGDVFAVSNLNRQIHAMQSTIGKQKTQVVKERIQAIDPTVRVNEFPLFYTKDTASEIQLEEYDYIIDAIDMVTAKIFLIESAVAKGVQAISAMGAGNRQDPLKLQVTDLSKTHTDPLAKVMRKELRKRGITHLKVVFSTEEPLPAETDEAVNRTEVDVSGRVKRWSRSVGSMIFVPAVSGLLVAAEVIKDLTDKHN